MVSGHLAADWSVLFGSEPKGSAPYLLSLVTLKDVLKLKAAEKAAKDAFYGVHSALKAGDRLPANYAKLQAAMISATRARQAAMTAYAASL